MRKLILNKGEKICPKCNGSSYSNDSHIINCYVCKNHGKLDWLSDITPRTDYRFKPTTICRHKKTFNKRKSKRFYQKVYGIKRESLNVLQAPSIGYLIHPPPAPYRIIF